MIKQKIFKRGMMRKYITNALKGTFYVDVENQLITDGYAIYVIDQTVRDLLKEFDKYETGKYVYGIKKGLPEEKHRNIKEIFDAELDYEISLDFTKYIKMDNLNKREMYVYQNQYKENALVNRKYVDIINYDIDKINVLGIGQCYPVKIYLHARGVSESNSTYIAKVFTCRPGSDLYELNYIGGGE